MVEINGVYAVTGKTFVTHPLAYLRRALNNIMQEGMGLKPSIVLMNQACYEHLLSYLDHFAGRMDTSDRRDVRYTGEGDVEAQVSKRPVAYWFEGMYLMWSPVVMDNSIRFYSLDSDGSPQFFHVGTISNTGV